MNIKIQFLGHILVLYFNTTENICPLKGKTKSAHILYDLISSFHDNSDFLFYFTIFFIFLCVGCFDQIDILFFTLLIWKFYYWHVMVTTFFLLILIITKFFIPLRKQYTNYFLHQVILSPLFAPPKSVFYLLLFSTPGSRLLLLILVNYFIFPYNKSVCISSFKTHCLSFILHILNV